jgi:hypothetical protein
MLTCIPLPIPKTICSSWQYNDEYGRDCWRFYSAIETTSLQNFSAAMQQENYCGGTDGQLRRNERRCTALGVATRGASLPTYLTWTHADLDNVERAVKRYKTAGFQASVDVARLNEGIVSLSQVDPRREDATIVTFEIHKFARSDRPGRTHWVIQIQTLGPDQVLQLRGCVSDGALVFAFAKAELDMHKGFASRESFDAAANAYWLK